MSNRDFVRLRRIRTPKENLLREDSVADAWRVSPHWVREFVIAALWRARLRPSLPRDLALAYLSTFPAGWSILATLSMPRVSPFRRRFTARSSWYRAVGQLAFFTEFASRASLVQGVELCNRLGCRCATKMKLLAP